MEEEEIRLKRLMTKNNNLGVNDISNNFNNKKF